MEIAIVQHVILIFATQKFCPRTLIRIIVLSIFYILTILHISSFVNAIFRRIS